MALTWQHLKNSVTISFSKELLASTQYLGNVVLFSSRLMGGEKNLHSYSWKPANQITSCQIVKVLSSYVCSICVRLWVCSLTHWKYSTIGLLTVSKHKTGIWKSIITLTKLLTSASSTEMTDGLKDTIYIIHLYRKTSRGSVGVISRLMDFLLTDQKGTTPPW